MSIAEALATLGANPSLLSGEERHGLDRDGFLHLQDVLSAEEVASVNSRLDAILEAEGDAAGVEVHQEAGTQRLANLVDKGEEFDMFFTHPKVLTAIAHVLRDDLKLSSLNARFALPGQGLQGLHADWGRLEIPGEYQVCNSIWLLDDFTPENGATRAVPGSHNRDGHLPYDEMVDPKASHPEEVLLLGRAGDMVVFNSHTWHGGTLNRTDARRRACHSYFCRRGQIQQLDQKKHLRTETLERLSEPAKTILDVI